MKPLLAFGLLALAVSAHAADHRLAYSKAENVEVFAEHAAGQPWCGASLQLRFAFDSATPDAAAVGRLLPKLGSLIATQCAAATDLQWYSTNNAGQRLASGSASQVSGWQVQVDPPSAPALAVTQSAVAAPSAPELAAAAEQVAVAPEPEAAVTAPAVSEPAPVAQPAVVDAPTAAEPAPAEPATSAPSADFTVAGWQPPVPSEVLANASFLTELADQNGCRFRLAVKLEDPIQNLRTESQGVTCGADGYAQGQGKLSVTRSDGVHVYSFNNGGFLSGLAVSSKVPNLPVAGFDDNNNLLLSLHSEPASKVHYLLRLGRNYNGSWNADGIMLALTENRDLFRDVDNIRRTIEVATARLDQVAPEMNRLRFYAMRDLEQGLFKGNRDFWLYELNLSRHYRTRLWDYNLQNAQNYLFAFERKEAEQQRQAELQRQREEQRQRELLGRQAEQQLQLYRQLRRETRKPDELYERISRDASYSPTGGGSYVSMLKGGAADYSQIVYIGGKTEGGWEVEYPYQAVLNTDDSEQDASKGWFLVKGKARLDDERLDKQKLPLTLVTVSSLLACQENECADLRDPLTLLRHEIGDPDWTVEGARDVIKQAWPDRAVEQGDEQ